MSTDDIPPPPTDDGDVPRFLADLGLPGIVDVHVHFMPEQVQSKVWQRFDSLEPAWPITYRTGPEERLETLRALGVHRHTALAYAHREGMAAWLNEHTLSLAASEPQVVPTFTLYPEEGVDEYVASALARGGRCVKVHLQVGKFDANDPRLDEVWRELERRRLPIVVHAAAVPDGSGGERWCGPRPIERLLVRFPGLVLVIAHAGAPQLEEFLNLVEQSDTLYLDTAMVQPDPPYLWSYPEDLLPRFTALGRVAFGSDFPSIPHPYAAQVRGIAGIAPDADWLRRVLWTTPSGLLGVDPGPDGARGA